jgi:hypothetical protein
MMYFSDFYGTLCKYGSTELYPDGASFLREKENSVIIITSGNPTADGGTIKNAIAGIPRMSVIYTEGVRKGLFLAPHIAMYGASPVFVDDSTEELESMQRECPGVQLFQMCRDTTAGHTHDEDRWPVVHSLSELP